MKPTAPNRGRCRMSQRPRFLYARRVCPPKSECSQQLMAPACPPPPAMLPALHPARHGAARRGTLLFAIPFLPRPAAGSISRHRSAARGAVPYCAQRWPHSDSCAHQQPHFHSRIPQNSRQAWRHRGRMQPCPGQRNKPTWDEAVSSSRAGAQSAAQQNGLIQPAKRAAAAHETGRL